MPQSIPSSISATGVKALTATMGPAAIAKHLGIARSSVTGCWAMWHERQSVRHLRGRRHNGRWLHRWYRLPSTPRSWGSLTPAAIGLGRYPQMREAGSSICEADDQQRHTDPPTPSRASPVSRPEPRRLAKWPFADVVTAGRDWEFHACAQQVVSRPCHRRYCYEQKKLYGDHASTQPPNGPRNRPTSNRVAASAVQSSLGTYCSAMGSG